MTLEGFDRGVKHLFTPQVSGYYRVDIFSGPPRGGAGAVFPGPPAQKAPPPKATKALKIS